MEYVSGASIRTKYQISPDSLRVWSNKGKIRVIRTPGGKRLYNTHDIKNLFGEESPPEQTEREKVCYARVSSDHQKKDLERQIKELKMCYPDYKIISDVGSGINYKRKGFEKLLDSCFKGDIEEIVVTNKDRLCRFGIELLEQIFKKTGVKLVVHSNSKEEEKTKEEELAQDLLSLVTIFVARNNGRRAAENRRRRENLKNKEDKTLSK
jgi:predicted site-specific integrase-resolvase